MSGFQKRLNLIVMLFVIHGCCVSKAVRNSCPVSPLTVETVDKCPDSEDKWRQAAARKNCAAYASQCDEPDRLVYHCVINAFVNQTLEVCAYSRIIVLGFCTEYSFGGNIIQQNIRTDCTTFTQNPCPLGYPSTESYKYPDCYKLTKKVATGSAAKTTPSTIKGTDMNREKQADEGTSDKAIPIVTAVVLVVITCLVTLIGMLYIWWLNKCPFSKRKDMKKNPSSDQFYCMKTVSIPKDDLLQDKYDVMSNQSSQEVVESSCKISDRSRAGEEGNKDIAENGIEEENEGMMEEIKENGKIKEGMSKPGDMNEKEKVKIEEQEDKVEEEKKSDLTQTKGDEVEQFLKPKEDPEQKMEALIEDNRRLKEENGALIRVIGKLYK